MRGINRVTLVGNLGRDPELKELDGGVAVVKMAIATTETYRLKNGESHTQTEWHTVIAWRGLASLAGRFLRKGSLVYIEGKIRYRQFDGQDGQKRHIAEIMADQFVMLDKKPDSGVQPGKNEGENHPPLPF